MRDILRFIAGVVTIIILIVVIKGCIDNRKEKQKFKDLNTQIDLTVEGFESEEWYSGGYLNSINVGFTNTGSEDIIKVTLTIHFFSENGNEVGKIDFVYDIYEDSFFKTVKQGESSGLHHKTLRTDEKAVRFTVTNLKVNGLDRQVN